MGYLSFAGHWVIGLIFACSAVGKLRGRAAFEEFAAATRRLLNAVRPGQGWRRAGSWGAGAVVVAEAAVPVLLVAPGFRRAGLGVAVALLVGFCVAITAGVRRGVRTPCRCFGASSAPLGVRHLIRNVILLSVSVAALGLGPGGQVNSPGLAVAGAAGTVLSVLLIRLDDVIDLFVATPMTRT